MATIVKQFIYTGTLQIADVPIGVASIDLYLWGGGGGAGGEEADAGSSGGAGHFVSVTGLDFTAYDGVKTMVVAVGGGGANGTTGKGAEGGKNGKSLTGYSGGNGGTSGTDGISGSGGGGGGATTVTLFVSGQQLNNIEVAIAGGGGGAGGTGYSSRGGPGINTNSATGNTPDSLGENGANHDGDGGGGGAGGGGADGGKGGSGATGDAGGFSGYAGSNVVPSGGAEDNGSSITPGGTGNAYYTGNVAKGGEDSDNSGKDGKAVVIFNIPAEAKHKVSGAWKNINEMYTKVSGTWKRLLGGYTKVSGTWKAFFGADVVFASNAVGFGDSDGGVTSGTTGTGGTPTAENIPQNAPAGGGGDGFTPPKTYTYQWSPNTAYGTYESATDPSPSPTLSVLCTELHRQGLMPDYIFRADQSYYNWMCENHVYTVMGYHKLFRPVVEKMKTSKAITSFVHFFAKPWSEHMAYTMGAREKRNWFGKFINILGWPICTLVGKMLIIPPIWMYKKQVNSNSKGGDNGGISN